MTIAAFAPAPQGSLEKALGKPGQLTKIAPASPRPIELLGSLTVNGGTAMTADDAALHELLISSAYESDRGMNSETATIPMSYVLRYLGADARRAHVKASLSRLRQTTVSFRHDGVGYEDVPLLVHWMRTTETTDDIVFQLPEPLRLVMSDRARYAYIELAALPAMSSTYSSRLYRRLVAAIAESGKQWIIDGDNVVTVGATPDEVADWVSFPRSRDGSLHVGKLRERVLSGLTKDFAAVRSFSFSMTTHAAASRGRPLERITFRMELAAPSRFMTRQPFEKGALLYVGGTDVAGLAVESLVWAKASKQFYHPDREPLTYKDWWELWLAAISEMETGVPLSRGIDERVYRGESLREKIASIGPEEAAWRFCEEEAAEPDLSLHNIRGLGEVGRAAREVRLNPVSEKSVTFEAAREVVLTVSPDLDATSQMQLVFKPITDHDWSRRGSSAVTKTLRVRFLDDGQADEWDQPWLMTEDDVVSLMSKIGPHLVGKQEYVA
ncbi:RepB family plasmid replication initiator protein [Rhizobium leguminosarum]|uniref:RepB family plasmid replication initiator protein n=1 Tax=Rhizobium leguminosarum TaxID=384 RepID=UPI001C945B52|nr:RepB family plasmid replication initiator protein [Rhizobium leguminosarum]MBY5318219.1 replication initiation protein [Rhizobium leguminosarum]